jgi:neural Wiskott-Aldrich syndrome protein
VYHKAFEASDREWTKTGHKGTVVFGRERSSGGDDMSSIGHGSAVDKEKYWFRLVDRGRTVWMIKVPSVLNYQLDKPFFHVFPGRVRRHFSIQRCGWD